jgi:hypothetical protein
MGEIGQGLEAARKTCRTNKHGWRPFIYALVYCLKTSELLSRSQCETVLDMMEEYISTKNTPNNWRDANKNAAEIDMANFPDRRWSINYSNSKPPKVKRFRRYNSQINTKRIQDFITVFQQELKAILVQRKDEPLTGGRVYIGWTVHGNYSARTALVQNRSSNRAALLY